jgi:hypothetical protein
MTLILPDAPEEIPGYTLKDDLLVIYQPLGKALEYAAWAISPFRGCGLHCIFCYVVALWAMQYQAAFPWMSWEEAVKYARREFHAGLRPKTGFLDAFVHDLRLLAERGISLQFFMSFMSDIWGLGDTRLTSRIMEMTRLIAPLIGWDALSKAGTYVMRDAHFFDPKRDAYGFSCQSLDADYVKRLERRAAPPMNRIRAALIMRGLGIFGYCSVEPWTNWRHAVALIKFLCQEDVVDLLKVGGMSYKANPLAGVAQYNPTKDDERRVVDAAFEFTDQYGKVLFVKDSMQHAVPEDRKAQNLLNMRVKQHR